VAFASLPSPPSAHTVPPQPSKNVHISSHNPSDSHRAPSLSQRRCDACGLAVNNDVTSQAHQAFIIIITSITRRQQHCSSVIRPPEPQCDLYVTIVHCANCPAVNNYAGFVTKEISTINCMYTLFAVPALAATWMINLHHRTHARIQNQKFL